MTTKATSAYPLSHYRALDLSDEKGFLCGRILADLGADVVKVERPGGDPSRRVGPFYHDVPHPEKSLYWFLYNANKRGITLNVETSDGCDLFRRLIPTAHFLIESFPPGHLDRLGLGYAGLHCLNPALILVSITPYGQTGPFRDFAGCDLVHMATSGMTYMTGDLDRAPLRIGVDQAYLQAGAQAAAAAMIAHYSRLHSGLGQHVDVSAHEAAACAAHRSSFFWDIGKIIVRREGDRIYRGNVAPRGLWACQDGHVSWRLWLGQFGQVTRSLVEWMNAEGQGAELAAVDWQSLDFNQIDQEQLNVWEASFAAFFLTHTKRELHEASVQRKLLLFPVNDTKDIVASEQLAARAFWAEIEHPEMGARLTYPGAVIKSGLFDCGIRFRAPLIGEHNLEVYSGELGLSSERVTALREAGVI